MVVTATPLSALNATTTSDIVATDEDPGYTTVFSYNSALSYALVSLLVPVGAAALVLNLLVVISVKLNPALRTPLDLMITSLAIVDMLTGVIGIPIIVVLYTPDLFLEDSIEYWKVNILWSTFNVFNLLSVWHVLLITIDRYLAIYHPAKFFRLQDRFKLRKWLLLKIIIFCWILACVFCYVPSMFLFVWGDDLANESTLTTLKHVDTFMLIFVDQTVPLVVVCVLNTRLFFFIRDHKSVERWTLENDIGLLYGKTVNRIRMTCIVSACLVVTYVPYLVKWWIEVAVQASPPDYAVSPEACLVIQFVQSLNSVVNPLVYAFQMPAYSYGYRKCAELACACCRSAGCCAGASSDDCAGCCCAGVGVGAKKKARDLRRGSNLDG